MALFAVVEHYHYGLGIVVTEIDIHFIFRQVLFGLPVVNYGFVLTPIEEFSRKIVILFLSSRTPRSAKSVLRIACPATREILSYIAIAFTLVACHCYLATVVQLWNASCRC